jgi:hypothetical protein
LLNITKAIERIDRDAARDAEHADDDGDYPGMV